MATNPKTKAKILAVDDSISMQGMIQQTLEAQYQVLLASNTVEALGKLYHEGIDLMLLDISMPGVDGLELCKILRKSPEFKKLPIIILTARDGASEQMEGRLAGATHYMTKPFDADELRRTIARILRTQNLGR
ncbi:MAG: Response regulators consisting of a CheY-like receiver domain and a winged-helix DNA-binding domain [Phormidium sp. OSCR]|nr:MAG: Response regulators consisting of a CheY-like receiver domain and a winged-helix DNA-binding domain [Phormidium sp. OSCR]